MSTLPAIVPLDISVVIPAYNRASMIGRAVLSALNQQPLTPAEVIVVDDGSSDGTGDIAEKLGARVIRQLNQGEGPARNTGIAAVTSSWVAFLDSDDEWLPNHLAVLDRYRERRVLVGSASRIVPSGRRAGIGKTGGIELTPATLMWPQSPLLPSSTMVRTDIAQQVGFRPLPTAADLDFFIRVLERGAGIAVPEVTSIYFEHPNQISVDNSHLKRGRTEVLRSFEHEPWFPAGVLRDVAVSDQWDDLRTAQRAGDWKKLAVSAISLSKPSAVRALADVMRYRKATRAH
jgi:glycosyltransferase involved in cell wall biosynthesis